MHTGTANDEQQLSDKTKSVVECPGRSNAVAEQVEWLLDELDRIWFCSNVFSCKLGKHRLPEKKDLEEAALPAVCDAVEMEFVRPLYATGKVRSTGDLPCARLKRFPRRKLLGDLVIDTRLFDDEELSSTTSSDLGSVAEVEFPVNEATRQPEEDSAAAAAAAAAPVDERRKHKLESIPSGSALATTVKSEMRSPTVRKRRRDRRKKHTKSLTELEFDELSGFRDLGFRLSKEEMTPRVVSLLPALQQNESSEGISSATKIYPSHAWLIRKDSPLLNLRMPNPHVEGVDMKEHLKFWARAVASTVRQEC